MSTYYKALVPIILGLCGILASCDQSQGTPNIQVVQDSVVDKKTNPNHHQPFIYFDDANNVQLNFESYGTVKGLLAQTCTSDELTSNPYFKNYANNVVSANEINNFNTHYYNVLMHDPKVAYLFCGNVPYSFKQYLLGIGTNGAVLWKYLPPFRFEISNVSPQGIVYQYLNNLGDKGVLGVISPQTGQLIYQSSQMMYPRGNYVYSSTNRILYLVTFSSSVKGHPGQLYEINTETGGMIRKNTLPEEVNGTDLEVTPDGKYLVILANSRSGKMLLIYDLKNNQWAGERIVSKEAPMGIPLIIFGKMNDIGLLLVEPQAYHLIHLHIKENDNVKS